MKKTSFALALLLVSSVHANRYHVLRTFWETLKNIKPEVLRPHAKKGLMKLSKDYVDAYYTIDRIYFAKNNRLARGLVWVARGPEGLLQEIYRNPNAHLSPKRVSMIVTNNLLGGGIHIQTVYAVDCPKHGTLLRGKSFYPFGEGFDFNCRELDACCKMGSKNVEHKNLRESEADGNPSHEKESERNKRDVVKISPPPRKTYPSQDSLFGFFY